MKVIKRIVEQIEDEICGAEEYAKCSVKMADNDKELSSTYKALAETELQHVDKLHEQIARIIRKYKEEGHEAPMSMQAVWDWEHEKMIDAVARIKMMMK